MKNCSIIILSLLLFSCNNNIESKKSNVVQKDTAIKAKPNAENIYVQVNDIPLPKGFVRDNVPVNSFAYWLRNVKLKKDKQVHLYNGNLKINQTAQFAVVDISVGKKDLQQCADAVMRLRAEYLFSQNKMNEIIFIDNEKSIYKFSEPYTRANFSLYLDKVFGMCGSASLAKQLKSKPNFKDIEIGDVLIRGGFPGHAVIVVDEAKNKSGNKIFLIAQSYMPAQEIHILMNNNNAQLSPWYSAVDSAIIKTPEYVFYGNELKGW